MKLVSDGRKPGQESNDVVLSIRVIPRARKNEVLDVLDDGRIKIRLSAPPVEGKANNALIKYLASIVGVSEDQIRIIKGHTSQDKLVSIRNIDAAYVNQQITGNIKSGYR